jgi:hypothetical protein
MIMGGKFHAQAALTPRKNVPLLIAYEDWSRSRGGLGASEEEKYISPAANRIIISLPTST